MGKMVTITNRNAGWTGYTVDSIHRDFPPKRSMSVDLEELKQLQMVPGGAYLLQHCFIINDKDALSALNMLDVEPEYFYTEEDIQTLLETGSLDQLEDCLNFAPDGVIELVKNIAVKIELPDTRKRDLITKKTGLNINNAIMVNTIMNEESAPAEDEKKVRKADPIAQKPSAPVRKYKVVE